MRSSRHSPSLEARAFLAGSLPSVVDALRFVGRAVEEAPLTEVAAPSMGWSGMVSRLQGGPKGPKVVSR